MTGRACGCSIRGPHRRACRHYTPPQARAAEPVYPSGKRISVTFVPPGSVSPALVAYAADTEQARKAALAHLGELLRWERDAAMPNGSIARLPAGYYILDEEDVVTSHRKR